MNVSGLMPSLLQRLSICYDLLLTRKYSPVIKTANDVLIDLEKRKIIISGDFHMHCTGDLRLSSDKHILLNSGEGYDSTVGERWGIWLNSDTDSRGKPITDTFIEQHKICGCSEECKHDCKK